jgi:hypothetical protein
MALADGTFLTSAARPARCGIAMACTRWDKTCAWRRLVESGVGFVTVNGWTGSAPGQTGGGPPASSWDMHGSEMGMGSGFGNGSYGMGWCLLCLDEGLSALLVVLRDRGMLERTLVVVMGEFGRTPRINQPNIMPGRQHWPSCWSAILAGGGIRGGASIADAASMCWRATCSGARARKSWPFRNSVIDSACVPAERVKFLAAGCVPDLSKRASTIVKYRNTTLCTNIVAYHKSLSIQCL